MMNIKGGMMVEQNVFVEMRQLESVPPIPTFRLFERAAINRSLGHISSDS
jgi:hypothetical protein